VGCIETGHEEGETLRIKQANKNHYDKPIAMIGGMLEIRK
jgi:hypothetical protein